MGQHDFDTRNTGDNVAEEKAIIHNEFLINAENYCIQGGNRRNRGRGTRHVKTQASFRLDY